MKGAFHDLVRAELVEALSFFLLALGRSEKK